MYIYIYTHTLRVFVSPMADGQSNILKEKACDVYVDCQDHPPNFQ